jgi:polysaccharide biosynthesis/export protein
MSLIRIVFSFLILCTVSCVSNKKLVYLQNKSQALADSVRGLDSTKNFIRTDYNIQINDVLSVTIRGLDPAAVAIFNSVGVSGIQQNSGVSSGGDIFYLNGYSVDNHGNIDLPVIGEIHVENLTLLEIKALVEKEASKYLKEPIVNVRLGGIRYSILGEVMKPGKNVILQRQLNIFEAIAHAGDLTTVANRSEVQIIRQFPEGPRVFEVDLTNRNILYSPYYFIQPNDIIYVKPLKVRSLGTGITGAGTFQSIVSVLSAVLLVITLTRIRQ